MHYCPPQSNFRGGRVPRVIYATVNRGQNTASHPSKAPPSTALPTTLNKPVSRRYLTTNLPIMLTQAAAETSKTIRNDPRRRNMTNLTTNSPNTTLLTKRKQPRNLHNTDSYRYAALSTMRLSSEHRLLQLQQ